MLKNGLKTAHNKSLKKSYKHLNAEEKRIVKAQEDITSIDRELYGYKGFYNLTPRTETGAINWNLCSDRQLEIFDLLIKKKERNEKILSKYDDNKISAALKIYNNSQFSFSQSFK